MAVYEVGATDSFPLFCKDDFNGAGYLFCSGIGDEFRFNRGTLRFVHSFNFGCIDPPDSFWGKEGEATPFIEIGKCSPV
jgi:hypothetical protein